MVDSVNPLVLSNVLINVPKPTNATPDNYEFYPNPLSRHKITYHNQFLFNSQFEDKENQWSVVNVDSVLQPYSVNVQCDTLLSGVPKVKNYPKNDTIHFFMVKVIAGDSLIFKSNKSLIIDLFDPSGKKIETISKLQSINNNAFYAKLDGEYYALVHGFSSADSGTYTLNYTHFPKYCILSYNRTTVENNGTDILVFKGNGFTKNTKITFTYGGNSVVGETILCNYLTVLQASFTFKNTPVGQYDISINYGDTSIVIEKGLQVVDSLTHTVLYGTVSMPTKGDYPFAGVYEYNNLILEDGTTLLSYGISQLVIKVRDTLSIGKDVVIRVRNGYYTDAPFNSISNITKENINNYVSYKGAGYSLYTNIYGKGGNGGNGANGGMGINQLIYLGYGQYYTIYGNGGSGGGGGGGGFGGGDGGYKGIYGVGTGGNGISGGSGYDNGGSGGFGGQNTLISTGGGAVDVGANSYPSSTATGGGGSGGGGNGGTGAMFGSASYGNGYGGPGGGGGGYGGGILVIAANEIICDTISKPMFLALGQKGGNGGLGGVGASTVSNGGAGTNGENGLVIINTPNQIPEFVYSVASYGSNYSPMIGGHGLVSGTAIVFENVDELENTITNVLTDGKGKDFLTIYPNPATEKVYVKTPFNSDNSNIVICTLIGERIIEIIAAQETTEVDISNLQKGIYLVRFESNVGINVCKLIKK
jgi:hypothetical protein